MSRTAIPAIAILVWLSIGLLGCDSVTETVEGRSDDATLRGLREATSEGTARTAPVCRPSQRTGWNHWQRTRTNADCTPPPPPPAATCPCFSAPALAEAILGAEPETHLLFDTFNFWNEDYRRTEVRATVDLDGYVAEEVAAVYIPRGIDTVPLPVMCFHQDVAEELGDWDIYYNTQQISVAEAEACRQAIYAFAGDEPCLGGACGLAYSADQLDPDYSRYENYDDGAKRMPLLFLQELDRLRSRYDASVSRFAR
jgi:hypothetical protein